MTRVGAAFILMTLVLAVAAVNTGNNSIYIAVAFMLGGFLLSGMASRGGLSGLDLEIGGVDEAWAGREAEAILTIRNRSRLWNVRDVVLTARSLSRPVVIPVIPKRGQVTVPAHFLFHRRGVVQVGSLDSYTRYPFGFVIKKRRLSAASDVVVFPRLLDAGIPREQFRPAAGDDGGASRVGRGSEVHSFREYVRGDSLRHLHWKKSASVGRWIIKQSEAETAYVVEVVVDPYKPRGTSSDEFEEMISAAATFIHESVRRGLEVRLVLPRVTVHARRSESAGSLFRALALLEPIYEPVHQALDRNAVLFALPGDRHAARTA